MSIMVDSCVYLDIFTRDPHWFEWSFAAMEEAVAAGPIVLNPIIYAEIPIRFDRIEHLDSLLPEDTFKYQEAPLEAAFLAGKCFVEYRRQGGQRTVPLPDFFIGAHASVSGIPLVTRDTTRFRHYFPRLRLVAPEGA